MNFKKYYEEIKNEFVINRQFSIIKGTANPIVWPNSSGVYVIWEKLANGMDKLIYIGMTGKFSNKNGVVHFNEASFKTRGKRWTPYRFCEEEYDLEMKFHFRYGPKESNTTKQGQIKYFSDAYNYSVSYINLEIHCFHINAEHSIYSPILLESLLLTKYLKATGTLPIANNAL